MKIGLAIILMCVYVAPVDAEDERIIIDAKINGRNVRFAFDTGAGWPFVLFSTTAQKLRLKVAPPPDKKPGPGQTSIGSTELCNLELGGTNFATSLGVVDLPPYLHVDLDGLLGWPAICENIFSIDGVADRIEFLTKLPAGSASWSKYRIRTNLYSGSLTLECPRAGGLNGIIAIDTGSTRGVELCSQNWERWQTAHSNQTGTLTAYYTPSIGLVVKPEAWAGRIAIGSLALTDVPVSEADSSDIALNSLPNTRYEATLGLAAVKRLDIIVDGQHGFAYLRPRQTPSVAYSHNRLGAVFVPQNLRADDLVARVVHGSPAFEAGVRDCDILLKISDLDCTQWRTDPKVLPLNRFWSGSGGTKLELTLKRGGKILKTTVILRNILPPDSSPDLN